MQFEEQKCYWDMRYYCHIAQIKETDKFKQHFWLTWLTFNSVFFSWRTYRTGAIKKIRKMLLKLVCLFNLSSIIIIFHILITFLLLKLHETRLIKKNFFFTIKSSMLDVSFFIPPPINFFTSNKRFLPSLIDFKWKLFFLDIFMENF